MGTNYYAMRIPTLEEYHKLVELVYGKDGVSDIFIEVARLTQPFNEKIHIGKSSAGWAFLFDHNHWEYYQTLEGLKEFLKTHRIIDEYGEEHTFEDFWDFVIKKQANPNNQTGEYMFDKFGLTFSDSVGFS